MATPRLLLLLLLGGSIVGLPAPPRVAAQPALEVALQSADVGPGKDFVLVVRATGVSGLFGLSFELVFSDSRWVDVTSAEPVAAFGDDVLFFSQTNDPDDETDGRVAVGLTRKAGQGGASGDVDVVLLRGRFSEDAPPSARLVFSLENVTSNDEQGNPITLELRDSDPIQLPVELVAFEAVRDGAGVVLRWKTASETNNAGFEVQHRQDAAAGFERLGYVEGSGTTAEPRAYAYRVERLGPGRHVFRLRQVDFDGTFAYGPELEVTVEMQGAFMLEPAYPNPFNPRTTIRFAVRRAQTVRVDLYDTMGRPLRTLYSGTPEANRHYELRIDGSALASGTYFVYLSGDGIRAVRQILLVK